jgi:hypothetical protein
LVDGGVNAEHAAERQRITARKTLDGDTGQNILVVRVFGLFIDQTVTSRPSSEEVAHRLFI